MRAFSVKKRGTGAAAKRVLVLTASNAALQAIAFLYRAMLLRLVKSEAMGLLSLVMQVYSLVVSVCISGLNVALITAAARCRDEECLRRLTRAALCLFAVLFLLAALPIFVLRERIADSVIGDGGAARALVVTLLCILMTGVENILKSVHIASDRVGRTAVSELCEQSIRLAAVYALIRYLGAVSSADSSALIMGGMLISEFFSVSFLTYSYKKHFCRSKKTNSRGIKEELGELIRILVPAAGTSIAGTVFAVSASLLLPSRLILSGYTRAEALSAIGVLSSAAIPLVMLPMVFVGASAVVAMPLASRLNASGDTAGLKRLTNRVQFASLAAFLIFDLPLAGLFTKISSALFDVRPTRLCFILLILKAGFIYMQTTASAVLNGMLEQRRVLLFAVIGESIQLALILMLTPMPKLHIYGYLIAMCVGEAIRFMLSSGYLIVKLNKNKRRD